MSLSPVLHGPFLGPELKENLSEGRKWDRRISVYYFYLKLSNNSEKKFLFCFDMWGFSRKEGKPSDFTRSRGIPCSEHWVFISQAEWQLQTVAWVMLYELSFTLSANETSLLETWMVKSHQNITVQEKNVVKFPTYSVQIVPFSEGLKIFSFR